MVISYRRFGQPISPILRDAASSFNFLPTFRDNISVPSSGSLKSALLGLRGCPETSATTYSSTLLTMPEHRRSLFRFNWSIRDGRSLHNFSKFLPDYTALLLMTSVFITMSLNSWNLTFVSWLFGLLTVLFQVWPDRKLCQWERRHCSWQLGRCIYSAGHSRWNRYVTPLMLHAMYCMFGVKFWGIIPICFIKNTLICLSATALTSLLLSHCYRNVKELPRVVCFLLGNSPASEFYTPTFRNPLSVPSS